MHEKVFRLGDVALGSSSGDVAAMIRSGTVVPRIRELARTTNGCRDIVTGKAQADFDVHGLAIRPPHEFYALAASASSLSVAIAFSVYLRNLRGSDELQVIVGERPEDCVGQDIAFPHFLRVEHSSVQIEGCELPGFGALFPRTLEVTPWTSDLLVWEVMPTDRLNYLGLAEGPVRLWRERISELLVLRSEIERGHVPNELRDPLRDRYLSFRFVCEHDRLLRKVVGPPAGRP